MNDAFEFNNTLTYELNNTVSYELKKREGTFETDPATPELAFVSQAEGISPVVTDSYTFDETGGEDVYVYILETKAFDLTLPVSRNHILLC